MSTEPRKIKLKLPVNIPMDSGGMATISEVSIERIRGKHLALVPKEVMDGKSVNPTKAFPLIAALTGLSVEVVGELDLVDLTEIMGVAFSQLGEGQASGQTGSH